MNIKSIISTVGIVFCLSPLFAQSFYNKELHVFNWGYGRTNTTFNLPGSTTNTAKVGHAPLTYEYFSRNIYWHSDILTPMIDLCLGAFNQQYWYGHAREGYIYNGGDWPMLRLAFGGYFGDRVGVFAGGQWGYSHWKIAPGYYLNGSRTYFIQDEKEVGGHTFGPSVHTVIDFDKLIIRNSLMYDFVTLGFKGNRYTNTLTWDIMAMYSLTHDNLLGVFVNYVLSPGRSDVHLSKLRLGVSLAFNN
jgi:hypothetical protein